MQVTMQESSHEMSQRTQASSSLPIDSNSDPLSLCYWQRINEGKSGYSALLDSLSKGRLYDLLEPLKEWNKFRVCQVSCFLVGWGFLAFIKNNPVILCNQESWFGFGKCVSENVGIWYFIFLHNISWQRFPPLELK